MSGGLPTCDSADLSDPHVTVASREVDAPSAVTDLSFDVTRGPVARHQDWEVRFEFPGSYVRLDRRGEIGRKAHFDRAVAGAEIHVIVAPQRSHVDIDSTVAGPG